MSWVRMDWVEMKTKLQEEYIYAYYCKGHTGRCVAHLQADRMVVWKQSGDQWLMPKMVKTVYCQCLLAIKLMPKVNTVGLREFGTT
jgi:hypothetical protein